MEEGWTKLTPEQSAKMIAEIQTIVSALNEQYLKQFLVSVNCELLTS